eukprot:SRR837773.15078.p2 GENE.SRR837773.15078~~SRR837773.15078.p2  ORF type:complete len:115 (-),score=11.55 SRR837773.15078:65-409(-)
MYVNSTWGDGSPGQDMCIVSGFGLKGAPVLTPDRLEEHDAEEEPSHKESLCGERFVAPPRPITAIDHNGIELQPACFSRSQGEYHTFIIGDWGGIAHEDGQPPRPADHRGPPFS